MAHAGGAQTSPALLRSPEAELSGWTWGRSNKELPRRVSGTQHSHRFCVEASKRLQPQPGAAQEPTWSLALTTTARPAQTPDSSQHIQLSPLAMGRRGSLSPLPLLLALMLLVRGSTGSGRLLSGKSANCAHVRLSTSGMGSNLHDYVMLFAARYGSDVPMYINSRRWAYTCHKRSVTTAGLWYHERHHARGLVHCDYRRK